MIEPMVDLGQTVRRGEPLARIWPLDRTGVSPETVFAKRDGMLAARHFPGLVEMGDCLAVLAVVSDA